MTMYHISRKDLGNTTILSPQIPDSSISSREGKKPRVCFSPSLRQCLHSLASLNNCTEADSIVELLPSKYLRRIPNPVVYVTNRILVKPRQSLSDFKLTEEHWSLLPIKVRRKGYIDIKSFMLMGASSQIPLTHKPDSFLTKAEWNIWHAAYLRSSRRLI